jgi:hypothetical protein
MISHWNMTENALETYNSALRHKGEDMDFMWKILEYWNLLI